MTGLALLWLESLSGLNLSEPAALGQARQRLDVYQRTTA
jgi:hypothetical protein